jgi:DNA transformation protein
MATSPRSEFAQYCCELLSTTGPCTAKRMFGGWGISTDGLTIAIIADLGSGEKLWLKASEDNRRQWEAAGCERFTYTSTKDGAPVSRGMNYYSAPEDAMDASHAMAPWARLALEAALSAKAAKPVKKATRPRTAEQKPRSLKPLRPVAKTATKKPA